MKTEPLDAAVFDDQHHEHHDDDKGQEVQALQRRSDEDDSSNDYGADESLPRLGPEGPPHCEVHPDQEEKRPAAIMARNSSGTVSRGCSAISSSAAAARMMPATMGAWAQV